MFSFMCDTYAKDQIGAKRPRTVTWATRYIYPTSIVWPAKFSIYLWTATTCTYVILYV